MWCAFPVGMFGSSAVSKRKDRKDHHLFSLSRDDRDTRAAKRERERERDQPRSQDVRDLHTQGTRMVAGAVGLGLLAMGVRNRHTSIGRFAIGIGVAALECAMTGYFPSVFRTIGLARAA